MGQSLMELLEDVAADVRPVGADLVDGAVVIARRRRRVRAIVTPVAIAVAGIAALLAAPLVVPGVQGGGALRPAATGHGPTLPTELADYSSRTASAQEHPAGRGIAVQTFYSDEAHAVVVGADSDTVRDLYWAPGVQGDAALLSPDGTQLAAPDENGVQILDLRSGRVRAVRLPDAKPGQITPVVYAFAGDSRSVIAGVPGEKSLDAVPYLLDARTGTATKLATQPVLQAAFSPDGTRIALSMSGAIWIVDRSGALIRQLATNLRGVTSAPDLAGPNAWSPDGKLLATMPLSVERPRGPVPLGFLPVDPATPTAEVPPSQPVPGLGAVLGWRSPTELVTTDLTGASERVVVRRLRGGEPRVLSTAAYGSSVRSLAGGLLADLGSRPAGDPDRGPWPLSFRVLAGLLAVLAAVIVGAVLLLVLMLRRRRSRLRA